MLVHPQFDPVALQLGPVAIHWYGLMYLAAFVQVILLGRWCIAHRPWTGWTQQMLDDVLFYGVLVVMALFARRHQLRWLAVTDFIAPLVPLGLAAGRLGNFINGELWGRATDGAWGMVFPQVDAIARHPSQLYQFALEGLLLFAILWWYTSRRRPMGAPSGLFLLGYGACRFVAEFAREPDSFLGYLAGGLTMGQWLSLPMIVAGVALMLWAHANARKSQPTLIDRKKG